MASLTSSSGQTQPVRPSPLAGASDRGGTGGPDPGVAHAEVRGGG